MSANPQVIRMASFSTNFESFSPISIIRQFFMSTSCKNITYIKDNHVEYEYILKDSKTLHVNFIEISNLEKNYNICSCADCFVVLVDLEFQESIAKIEQTLNYIKEKCAQERKIYCVGIYNDKDKIPEELKENNIKKIFINSNIIYDYCYFKLDSTVDIVKIFDEITQETYENKIQNLQNSQRDDISNSGCNIY